MAEVRFEAVVIPIVLSVLAVTAAMWVVARRLGRRRGFTFTRITHLAPDAKTGWLHVLGARRSMPEHGDAVDHWAHLMVEPRAARWLCGDSRVGGDLTLGDPTVARSLKRLQSALGWRPQLERGGTLRVQVRREDEATGPLPKTGLVVEVRRRWREPATQPCVATLIVEGRPVGTHAFEALGDSRFTACLLDEARVVVFGYVGVAWGDPEAHLVAFEVDSGVVMFDQACAYRPE